MNFRFSTLICLAVLIVSGCGNSFRDAPQGQTGPQPALTATIQINHVLARMIPNGIDGLRFLGHDQNDQVVYGPEERAVEATIKLMDISVLTKVFTIEYLSQGQTVGRFVTGVNLVPGETFVINDPNWVNVGDYGPPVELQFMVGPATAQSGRSLNPAVSVVVLDAVGRQVEDYNGAVTVALGPNSPNGMLSGSLTVNASQGVAIFSNLSVNLTGSGYTLVATANSLPSVSSHAFDVKGAPFLGASDSIVYRATLDSTESHFSCGDLNGDGRNDVVMTMATELQVLLGTAEGGFEVANTVALSDVVIVRIGDVTGDGRQDVVVLVNETTQSTTLVLSGDGTGNLGAPVATSLPVSSGGTPVTMELADLNGDGRADAVIVGTDTSGGAYYVEISNGTGLGNPTRVGLSAPPRDVVLGQLLGSAAIDMAISVGPDMEVFTGAGNGTFTSTLNVTTNFPPEQVAIADVDGLDGNDLVTVYSDGAGSTETAIYLNNIGDPFTNQALGSPYHLAQSADSASTHSLAVGDLNGDNRPDFAHVAATLTSTVITRYNLTVQLSDPSNGSSLYPDSAEYRLAGDSPEMELCDFNSDGLLDALLSSQLSTLTRLNSESDGVFLPLSTPAINADSVLVADVNNDGRDDVVTLDGGSILVYLRDATGAFPAVSDFSVVVSSGGNVLRLADMNDDRFLDAVIGGVGAVDVVILPNPGSGDFDPTLATNVPFANGLDTFAIGRVNDDDFSDIVGNDAMSGLQVVLSNGALSYDPSVSVTASDYVLDLRLVNLDADPELEVVAAQGPGGLGVYQNIAGELSEAFVLSLDGNEVHHVAVGDLNGDGIEDVLAGGRLSDFSELYVMLNPQTGGLSVSQTISDSRILIIQDLLIGDTNADGAADLLVSDTLTGGIAVLTGDGNGTTFNRSLGQYYAGGVIQGETALALTDLDGDGTVEIVATASGAWITLLTLLLLYGLRAFTVRRVRVTGTA